MKVTIKGQPPKGTAQQRRWARTKNGVRTYKPKNVLDAERFLYEGLIWQAPEKPFEGPVSLRVRWIYKTSDKKKIGHFKITRPDTDNLQKLLKDVMTKCGYWKDDALVCIEHVEKLWSELPLIEIEISEIHGG